ncbi:hypothetical protein Acsp02_40660 [Actinoplanes sp. NBRC 103695]|nr:hypothetical protein Acsp02_40660 [Actinoplanes sp. NBRC 103695]
MQGGDQTARTGPPLPLAVVADHLIDGQTVGDNDEGTSFGHAECTSGSLLVPTDEPTVRSWMRSPRLWQLGGILVR